MKATLSSFNLSNKRITFLLSLFIVIYVGKSGFESHTKHTAEATNMDLFHS